MNEDSLKIILLEKRISISEVKIKTLETQQEKSMETLEILSKNFLLLSTTLKEKSLLQQQIAEQMVVISETVESIETAINPARKIGYDITKEPYN